MSGGVGAAAITATADRIKALAAAVIGFLIMAAYWPMYGAPVVPRWMVAGLMLPVLLMANKPIRITRTHWIGLMLLMWLMITLLWAPGNGLVVALCLLAVAVGFIYGSALDDVAPFVIGAICGLALSSAIVVVQQFVELPLPYFSKPAALFYNPNILAEAGAVVIVAAIALELWWGAVALAPTLLLTGTRTPLIATVVALVTLAAPFTDVNKDAFRQNGWRLRLLVGAMTFVALLMVIRGNADSISLRLQYWQDTVMALYGHCRHLLIGYGLGSFWSTFPDVAQHQYTASERPNHAHNEILEIAYEGGLFAVLLGAAFCVALINDIRKTKLAAVVVVLAIMAMTAFPLRVPATALFGAVVAGYLTRRT